MIKINYIFQANKHLSIFDNLIKIYSINNYFSGFADETCDNKICGRCTNDYNFSEKYRKLKVSEKYQEFVRYLFWFD